MSDNLSKHIFSQRTKEELVMREVLAGLEDIITTLSYDPWPGDFEIVAIHKADPEQQTPSHEETVVKTTPRPPAQAQVICYHNEKQRRSA